MPSRTLLNEDDTDAVVPCPCGTDWWDEWDCLCNDRCPTCDAEIEPDEHEAIQGAKSAKIRTLDDRFRKSLTGGRVMMTAAVMTRWTVRPPARPRRLSRPCGG